MQQVAAVPVDRFSQVGGLHLGGDQLGQAWRTTVTEIGTDTVDISTSRGQRALRATEELANWLGATTANAADLLGYKRSYYNWLRVFILIQLRRSISSKPIPSLQPWSMPLVNVERARGFSKMKTAERGSNSYEHEKTAIAFTGLATICYFRSDKRFAGSQITICSMTQVVSSRSGYLEN